MNTPSQDSIEKKQSSATPVFQSSIPVFQSSIPLFQSSSTQEFLSAPVTGIPVNNQHHNENVQNPLHHDHDHHLHHGHDKEAWSTGLCDCCSDCKSCCITCWCPCVTFGRIAEIVDRGATSCAMSGGIYGLVLWFTGCGCIYSCSYRSKLRQQYMLEEKPCDDCLVHCCCESCALCQEYRELQSRGFDMSNGWQGHVERQNRGVAMPAPTAPVFEGVMNR